MAEKDNRKDAEDIIVTFDRLNQDVLFVIASFVFGSLEFSLTISIPINNP